MSLIWWVLARELLHMCGTISCEHLWEGMPDLFFYRDPEETEKEEQAAAEKAETKEEFQGEWTAPAPQLLLSLRLQTGLTAFRCPLCLFRSSLLKTGGLSLPRKTGLQLPLLRPLKG